MVSKINLIKGFTAFGSPNAWVRVAQFFCGSFFINAGIFKAFNYFIIGDQSLVGDLNFWIGKGYTPGWLLPIIELSIPYASFISIIIILIQIACGLFIALNLHARLASIPLLILQGTIFLSTMYDKENIFNAFVGLSIWMCIYYFILPKSPGHISKNTWGALCFFFTVISLLFIKDLFKREVLFSCCSLQVNHLAGDIFSIHPLWKYVSILIMESKIGALVINLLALVRVISILMLISRYRIYAGSFLLLYNSLSLATWYSGARPTALLWLIGIFILVAQEYSIHTSNKLNLSSNE